MTNQHIASICVFCGSASGSDPIYIETARNFGRALANADKQLVYGGGKVGLMGAVADAALAHGTTATGIMPSHLVEREIAHRGLTELITVSSMHERKTKMSELADAFVVLPGGAGTLEEAFEQWTWVQIGLHQKPIAFLNIKGYFDPLLQMVDGMVASGFLASQYRDMLIVEDQPEALIARLQTFQAPARKNYEPTAAK